MPKTNKEMIQELYQVIIGIKNNPDDNGMIGDIKNIEKHLATLNGQVRTNTTFRVIGTWLSCSMVLTLLSIITGFILKLW